MNIVDPRNNGVLYDKEKAKENEEEKKQQDPLVSLLNVFRNDHESEHSAMYELKSSSKSDNKVVVHTCREYFDKIKEGFGAYTTYDKSMESFFIDACQPVYFLLESQIPKNTNFDKEVFSDLDALPAKMGEIFRVNRHFVCDDEPNLLAYLKARMSPYEEVKKEQTPTSINMKSEHEAIGFDILARSDFNLT